MQSVSKLACTTLVTSLAVTAGYAYIDRMPRLVYRNECFGYFDNMMYTVSRAIFRQTDNRRIRRYKMVLCWYSYGNNGLTKTVGKSHSYNIFPRENGEIFSDS